MFQLALNIHPIKLRVTMDVFSALLVDVAVLFCALLLLAKGIHWLVHGRKPGIFWIVLKESVFFFPLVITFTGVSVSQLGKLSSSGENAALLSPCRKVRLHQTNPAQI